MTYDRAKCMSGSQARNTHFLARCVRGTIVQSVGEKKREKGKRGKMDKKVNALEFCLAVAARSVSCCEIKSACLSC